MRLFFLFIFLLCGEAYAQSSKPQSLSSFLFATQRNDLVYSIQVLTDPNGYWKMGKANVVKNISSHPSISIKKQADNLAKVYDDQEYLPLSKSERSFIGEYVNEKGAIGIYFSSLMYSSELNNIRLDIKERARKVTNDFILDFLKDAYEYVDKTKYKSIAVHTMYISRNFLDDKTGYNRDAEGIIMSIDMVSLKSFINNNITDQALLKKASFYLYGNKSKSYRKVVI